MDARTHHADLEAQRAARDRQDYVASLRALADFIDAHPHIELSSDPDVVQVYLRPDSPATFAPRPDDCMVTRRTDYMDRPYVAVTRPVARFAQVRSTFNDVEAWDAHAGRPEVTCVSSRWSAA